MSAKKRTKKRKVGLFALFLGVVLILVALLAVAVKCAKRDEPGPDPLPVTPEIVVELDTVGIVFGGSVTSDPDPEPDPEPGETDFTLNTEELLYVPGGETSATLTATKAGVTWTAEWEDPASEWAGGKRTENYVRLTPSGRTVNIEFLAPFGERVKIVCSDGSGSRECLCGCLKTVKTYKGYFRVVDSMEANTYFGYDTFTFGGTHQYPDSDRQIVEEESYFPYTEEQTLEWDIGSSEYRLTQEFIVSFRAYAETSGSINENIRARLGALSAEKAYSVLNDDGEGYTVFCGAGTGFGFCFPPLCEGLEKDDKYTMGMILMDWYAEGSNAEIEMIEAVYRFTGSRADCEMILRQRAYFGRERPEEYGKAS